MKIAVVARMLRKDKLEGFGVFTHELFSRITSIHKEHEFMFLFDRPYAREFVYGENVHPFLITPAARHPVLLAWWYQFRLKSFLDKHKPDLLVSPDGGIPLKSAIPSVSIIHDLNFEHFPEDMPFFTRMYYRKYYRRAAVAANHLITVSEFSKKDLVETYSIDEKKISVVYNGVSDKFRQLDGENAALAQKKFAQGRPYFLFVGSIHKRKNIPNMIRAYTRFRKSIAVDIKFVIAGAKRWWDADMDDAIGKSDFRNDLFFTGRVSDNDLPLLTGGASALLFASRFEGFGIPIIEAMKCGVPVITSANSSMPEIAGGAALLVDPGSPDAIADAMKKIWLDEGLRNILVNKGFERAIHFSWDRSAEKLWNLICSTIQ